VENNIIELDQHQQEIVDNYRKNGKLCTDFPTYGTYDMVQSDYPIPHGKMVKRYHGGIIGDKLLPPYGMWCKVEDVEIMHKSFLSIIKAQSDLINTLNTMI
jgi:hypothetical protein